MTVHKLIRPPSSVPKDLHLAYQEMVETQKIAMEFSTDGNGLKFIRAYRIFKEGLGYERFRTK